MSNLYIGAMTGTSLDGLDVILADFSVSHQPVVIATHSVPYPDSLRRTMLDLQTGSKYPCVNELHISTVAGIELAELHNDAICSLLLKTNFTTKDIKAIGVHGQTVRHVPNKGFKNSPAYTIQLIDATRIAEALNCTVVHNFRSRDIAAGGQGAPLVPAFHAAIAEGYLNTIGDIAIVNIGGFSNITLISNASNAKTQTNLNVLGLDTGPGNVLMDAWIQRTCQLSYDDQGYFATTGRVHDALLIQLLKHPYFKAPLPKSTGREAFDLEWLDAHINDIKNNKHNNNITSADIQATLSELTATTIANHIAEYLPTVKAVYVCGGGAFNTDLMRRLHDCLYSLLNQSILVNSTINIGIDPQQMECLAFAWLARQCILGLSANVPKVTGAKGYRVLGQITPA